MTVAFTSMTTPVGELRLAGDGHELWAVWLVGQRHAPAVGTGWRETGRPFAEARRQLDEYFSGARAAFDLPLRRRGTPFQLRVWDALERIPYGETRSYGALAAAVGRPDAARAVGAANGRNPFAVVVPCHRLVGATGRLVDYAAGLEVKRQLLAHEAAWNGRRAGGSRPGC